VSVVEQVKSKFTRHDGELQYKVSRNEVSRNEVSGFVWCGPGTSSLPDKPGVYCLFSHDDSRIHKVGMAERTGGLRDRFGDYTVLKTPARIARDPTDQLWQRVMTGPLRGERLSIYYYVTEPEKKQSPIRFEELVGKEFECHWARALEKYLDDLVCNEYKANNLLGKTHFLLSQRANYRASNRGPSSAETSL
jgi:hypothetical protein